MLQIPFPETQLLLNLKNNGVNPQMLCKWSESIQINFQ